MTSLERNLLRLSRKNADPDFVNKLLQRIHHKEVLVRLTIINGSNQFQCRQWQTIQYCSFRQKKEESVEVHFHPTSPRPRRKQLFSKIPQTKQNFLWATKEMKGETNDSERLSYHPL
jgi:hypothetical protein